MQIRITVITARVGSTKTIGWNTSPGLVGPSEVVEVGDVGVLVEGVGVVVAVTIGSITNMVTESVEDKPSLL
jgi:hypothetical protein